MVTNDSSSVLREALSDLFSQVPPEQLRKSMHEIFARYLQTIDNITDLEHFKVLAEDFYFLHRFLEKAEESLKKEEAHSAISKE